jgi:thioredoxin 1
MLAPELEKLVNEGVVSVGKVDVDENEGLAEKYEVSSIPTLLLFKKGELKAKSVGFVPYEQLKDFVLSNK